MKLLDKVMADTKEAGMDCINGKDAFTLYDTYGFPLDLTELILKENGLSVDTKEFDAQMQQQKERARNAAAIETGDWVVVKEGEPRFIGYDFTECDAEILRYRKIKQKNKELYQIVLDQTPFYAESGGQVGDTGTLTGEGETIKIINTKKENNLSIHISEKLPKDITATLRAVINKEARLATACNHSATHLLHEALRTVLGTHVEQKGSLVTPDILRFDFSHFQKVTDEELRLVEQLANRKVRQAIPLNEHRNVPIAEAKQMGAMALFGEKYGDEVRVIQYGSSIELCGGTHVANTGNIGMIRIISESSIAAGVRRIEAVSAAKAEELVDFQQDTLKTIRQIFNNVPDITAAIRKAIDENADLKKRTEEFIKEKVALMKESLLKNMKERSGMKIILLKAATPAEVVKDIAFQIRGEVPEHLLFVAGTVDEKNKPLLTVMLSDDLVSAGLNASALVREGAKYIQGGGGGQPHFAQAGGKNPEGISVAIDKIIALAEK